jgi:hypothetical protein
MTALARVKLPLSTDFGNANSSARGSRAPVHLCPSRTLIQLHSSFAGGNSGQVGMDDVLLPAPPLDPDAALDPVALLDP